MRISDWSSDVCSSDLLAVHRRRLRRVRGADRIIPMAVEVHPGVAFHLRARVAAPRIFGRHLAAPLGHDRPDIGGPAQIGRAQSELQSLMRISYAVFCLKQQKKMYNKQTYRQNT